MNTQILDWRCFKPRLVFVFVPLVGQIIINVRVLGDLYINSADDTWHCMNTQILDWRCFKPRLVFVFVPLVGQIIINIRVLGDLYINSADDTGIV